MSVITLKMEDKFWVISGMDENSMPYCNRIPMNGRTDEVWAEQQAREWAKKHRPCKYIKIDISGCQTITVF